MNNLWIIYSYANSVSAEPLWILIKQPQKSNILDAGLHEEGRAVTQAVRKELKMICFVV